mmetsp:Transcript_72368/g.192930  ORF Transcript_72368/g.192930 Transcript_72368/m.192930 type:complete len:453 (-) Transcript_72368:97-1455(-)
MAQQTNEDMVATLKKYKKVDVDDEDDDGTEPAFVDKPRFQLIIGLIIILNALFIGLETDLGSRDPEISQRVVWYVFENIFCLIFFIELMLRFYYHQLQYFASAWNCLDFALVMLAVADTWMLPLVMPSGPNLRAVSTLRVVRILRLVRLIRLLRMFKELWLIVNGLIESMKTLVWVSLLLLLFCYVCAIFTTMQIGQDDATYDEYERKSGGWDHEEYFGTVPKSMYTLFQVLTLESWSEGIARHVISQQPMMVLFFIVYLMFTQFGLLNLVVGVIVENTLAAAHNNEEKIKKQKEKERLRVLQHLRDVFEMADEDGSGTLTIDEFREAIRNPEVANKLKLIDLPVSDAEELFIVLDHDGSGELSVDEFIGGCVRLKGNAKSKDLLAVQISVESLGKRLDWLEEKLEASENKIISLDTKTLKMEKQARQIFSDPNQRGRKVGGAVRQRQPPAP